MDRLSATVPEDLLEEVEDYKEREDLRNRSEAVRELLQEGLEAQDLRAEIDSLEARLQEQENRERERDRLYGEVQELALELREDRETPDPPFPVRWWRWWRSRDRDQED